MNPDAIFAKGVLLHRRLSTLLTDYPLRTFLMAGVAHQPLLFGAAR